MPISKFEQVHRATNLGLSRFTESLPLLLRAGLLLLFLWCGIELFHMATGFGATFALVVMGLLALVTFVAAMAFTGREYFRNGAPEPPSKTTSLWPFLLINLLMILLVAVIGKWEQYRGQPGFTCGLLGFTQFWVHKIGGLLTGGR